MQAVSLPMMLAADQATASAIASTLAPGNIRSLALVRPDEHAGTARLPAVRLLNQSAPHRRRQRVAIILMATSLQPSNERVILRVFPLARPNARTKNLLQTTRFATRRQLPSRNHLSHELRQGSVVSRPASSGLSELLGVHLMRTVILSVGVACVFVIPAWAQSMASSAAPVQAPSAALVQKASPAMVARMQALRDAYATRTAVYDRTEQAFRTPTDAERAALSASAQATASPTSIVLPGGGVAMRGAGGEVSFLVAQVNPDGSTAVHHAGELPQRPAFARPLQPLAAKAVSIQPAREVRHAE